MIAKRFTKNRLIKAIFGCLFGMIGMLGGLSPMMTEPVYAVTDEQVTSGNIDEGVAETGNVDVGTESTVKVASGVSCDDSIGSMGWLVCPTTGAISKAVDFLYDKIEPILAINPVEMKRGNPIYEIWMYAKGIANVVFILFLLVVVYSQLTGLGITNYGVKKALPKLIVAAIMVNLSFVICSIAVDVSNIIGSGLRGVFTSIEESTMATMGITSGAGNSVRLSEIYASLGGGALLTIGAIVVGFETGAIWMLIPTVLGAIVAVVVGLVTIAMRQAVVTLLIMIAPLAVVAYILPNTEKWFKMWKELLMRMLVFYPLFSLLFGASSLAGWAIVASAKGDGFMILLGVAVQIFPLFFSWSLMKMSGTVLGTINSKLTTLASGPLARNRSWAESRRDATKAKNLASERAYTPSLALMQYMNNRRIAREEETNEYNETIKNRGLAYAASRNYRKNGAPSRRGEKVYKAQVQNLQYAEIINRHKNNMNGGFNTFASKAQEGRIGKIDKALVKAADNLEFELSRGAKIEYDNAEGYWNRVNAAMDAHHDEENAGDKNYQMHNLKNRDEALERYKSMKKIMGGDVAGMIGSQFVASDAAHKFHAQSQIVKGKFRDYFDLTVPTQDVENRLRELTTTSKGETNAYIDSIISGLQTLNARGDTTIVRRQLKNTLAGGKIELGTYASQALATFLMFDVKDNDPTLRRFGKYLNMETAQMFNENDPEKRRTRRDVSYDEYIDGEYEDYDGNAYDDNPRPIKNADGTPKMRKVKRDAMVLLKGTSFSGMEREAIQNLNESIRESAVEVDSNGNKTFDYEKFKKNGARIWDSIMPNIISDQYTYLSGSEQIMALSKGVTGVDVKERTFDWKGIFGEYADGLTNEQRADYLKEVRKRTKTFQGGQVTGQIARSKTDMLDAITTQLALANAVEKDPELAKRLMDPNFKWSDPKNDPGRDEVKNEYDKIKGKYWSEIQDDFVGMYAPKSLEGFIKQDKKGFQGEAKDALYKLLQKELDASRARTGNRNTGDDEDGMPVGGGESPVGSNPGPIYSGARSEVESLFGAYNGQGKHDVTGFWGQAKDIIMAHPEINNKEGIADYFDTALPQYTSVDALYADIIRKMFGGF